MRHMVVAATLAAALAAPAVAAGWTLDKSHAHITFTADHFGFSTVHGQFRTFDAALAFDPEKLEATDVTFTIDAASIDTLWPARDEHLRGADFLDVDNHPRISFVSKAVTKTSDTTAEITGDLTLRGVTRETTFDVTLNKIGPSPLAPDVMVAGFTVTGAIVRAEHGITFASGVFDVIPVRADFEIRQQK